MYYLLLGFFYILSKLPAFALYAFGDFIRWLVFGVIGYRKKVVLQNLAHAFPEKSAAEREAIAHDFFIHFIDTWMETIRLLSMSRKGIEQMLEYDYSLLEKYAAKGQSVQLMAGHFMNWELINMSLPIHQPLVWVGIYMKLSSKAMERLFLKIRGRFGAVLVPAQVVRDGMEQYLQQPYLLGLGADQSPSKPAQSYWMYFLNQPTAFAPGPGRNACKRNLPVVFFWIERKKRGKYVFHLESMFESAEGLTPEKLTIDFAQRLEKIVRQRPANYLWSHRRWKHAWKDEYADNWIDSTPPPSA